MVGTRVHPPWVGGANWRRLGIALYYLLAVAASLAFIAVSHYKPAGGASRAEVFLLPAIDAPPPRGAGMDAALPYRCSSLYCATMFRLSVPLDQTATGLWSIYVPTFSGHLKLWLNDVLLTDTRALRTSAVIKQTEPLLVTVPDGLLHAGDNRIEIRLESRTPLSSFLDRVYIGPDETVRSTYDLRYGLLKTLPRLLVAWEGALALSLFVAWLGRRKEQAHLVLSGILFLDILFGLPQFLSASDSAYDLILFANLTSVWQVSLLPRLLAHMVGQPPRPSLKWVLGVPSVVTALFVLRIVYPPMQSWFGELWVLTRVPWMIGMIGLASWTVLYAAIRRRNGTAQILSGGLIVTVILCGHDMLALAGAFPDQQVFVSQFTGPLMTTLVCALLMWRFAAALNEVSRFNRVLRQEVETAETALRASFAREQAEIHARAQEAERQRLTRDLHDGLAGQLMSIVARCELHGPSFRDLGMAARRALDDLRLVVASLEDVGDDLAMMLAQFRERTEPQLQAQGIALEWQMSPLPDVAGLRSEHVLALFRILQEAVSNSVRHSASPAVTITMAPAPADSGGHAVRIVVADRGRGGAAARLGGRGIHNMQHRAAALGAAFTLETDGNGTRVRLDLPATLPDLPVSS